MKQYKILDVETGTYLEIRRGVIVRKKKEYVKQLNISIGYNRYEFIEVEEK